MIVFGLRPAPIVIIAVLLGFSVVYMPLFALSMVNSEAMSSYGSLDLQTSQPRNGSEFNSTKNYATAYGDRISEAMPDSPAAPLLGPILIVSIGLIASVAAYITLKRRALVLER